MSAFTITPATVDDVSVILRFILALAEYEKLAHEVVATEDGLREALEALQAAKARLVPLISKA